MSHRFAAPLLVLLLFALALGQVDFDAARKRQQESWRQRQQQVESSWQQRQEALEQNWEEHLRKVREFWADQRLPSREEYVSYAENYHSRTTVTFSDEAEREPGLVVEVLVPADSRNQKEEAARGFRQELERFREENGEQVAATISDGQGGTLESADDADAAGFVEEATSSEVRTPEGEQMVRYEIHLPAVPDHLKKRAEQWRPRVQQMARHYELPADLVFAVIQTESYFNANARSHVPAFGLMQLVPRYGGAEAWEMIKGRPGEPSPGYLYNGENNIELGAAYLHKLRYTYYRNVADDEKAHLLIICAYNTGPGNVNRALTSAGGNTRQTSGQHRGFKKPQNASSAFGPALEVIERLSVEELRAKLLRDLPWEETVGYLEKVSERRENYLAWAR